jgi:hypothetical protein
LVNVPSDGHVQTLRWGREVRQVLGDELVPVAAKEAETAGARHLGDELAVVHARQFVQHLDLGTLARLVQERASR